LKVIVVSLILGKLKINFYFGQRGLSNGCKSNNFDPNSDFRGRARLIGFVERKK
jgi:hypothetical protein